MPSGNVSPSRASVPDDGSVWADVVGQDRAVDALRRAAVAPVHAYLFVGPPGSTKDEAARAFAALLLTGSEDGGHARRPAGAGRRASRRP